VSDRGVFEGGAGIRRRDRRGKKGYGFGHESLSESGLAGTLLLCAGRRQYSAIRLSWVSA
jgi:hypothetical protein